MVIEVADPESDSKDFSRLSWRLDVYVYTSPEAADEETRFLLRAR